MSSFVCVSDQHGSLFYFGHWAHCIFSFLFIVIPVNLVNVIISE